MTKAYYNELDPFAAQWLRNLIAEGLIADGDVDERSIEEIQPNDLEGYCQCHFFAGIGGWSYALRLAGWPDDRPVWTGSCPCQPYSRIGKGIGDADPRNQWPNFRRLIIEQNPQFVFGEQVEKAIRHGWLDGISADLEKEGYTIGACVLGAHSVHSPHIRQRLYWVAYSERGATERQRLKMDGSSRSLPEETRERERIWPDAGDDGNNGVALGDTEQQGLEGHAGDVINGHKPGRVTPPPAGSVAPPSWDRFDVVRCIEPTRQGGEVEKWRRVEPGTFPLAHGIPARVGRLRGYGNAIVPQVAAEFIRASVEAINDCHSVSHTATQKG